MIKLKTKIVTILLISVMLSVSFTSAISAQNITTETKKTLIDEKSSTEIETSSPLPSKGFFIPRLFVASLIVNDGFEIISAEADQTQHDSNGTYYTGNVEIKCRLNGNSAGYACSILANKIGIHLFNIGIDPSILPGWYNFEEEFTIKARFFFLSDYLELEGIQPTVVGFGFFVRITK